MPDPVADPRMQSAARLRYNLLLQPACLVADEQQQQQQLVQHQQQQHVLQRANLHRLGCAWPECMCPGGRQKLRRVKSI